MVGAERHSPVEEPPTPPTRSAPPSASKAFSRQQLAYALALLRAGEQHYTETALRRPPKAKEVKEGVAVTFAELATELRLKKTLSDEDLLSPARAAQLWHAARTLSQEEQHDLLQVIEEAMAAIVGRRALPLGQSSAGRLQEEGTPHGTPRWPLPPTTLFAAPRNEQRISQAEVRAKAQIIQQVLNGQKVYADVLEEYITIGNKVLSFGVLPTGMPLTEHGQVVRDGRGAVVYSKETRVSEITKLKSDLQARLRARKIRMLDPVPGEPYVGIEIPNPSPTTVLIRDVLEDPEFRRAHLSSRLVVALGRTLSGTVLFLDMEGPSNPHLLIAGSTGGGKSVCVNTIITSLLTSYSPEDVRLLMIDPKRVELSFYNGIPHLIGTVVTEVNHAATALLRAKAEMERRYKLFEQVGVRNLKGYRSKRAERLKAGDPSLENLPSIVVVIDEIAELMEQEKEKKEELDASPETLICRIAALGRAAGLHLILATQRPTVDVITGKIKANIPAKIAFLVGKAVDSRVILDENGAEELDGGGDGIVQSPAHPSRRFQCAYTSDEEAERLVEYWKHVQPLGRYEVQPIDRTQMQQQSLLDLPEAELRAVIAADSPAKTQDASSVEQIEERLTEEHIEAFLAGEPIPFTLSELPKEQLYRLVVPWVKLRPSVTRDEIRIHFEIGQTRAGEIMVRLQDDGLIGPAPGGGRPRPVLVTTHTEDEPVAERASPVDPVSSVP